MESEKNIKDEYLRIVMSVTKDMSIWYLATLVMVVNVILWSWYLVTIIF
jgi:hypothetical protein